MLLGQGHIKWHLALGGERGQIAFMVAFSALILIVVAGLALDVGRLYVARAQLSRAVDAAALAGVLEFDGTTEGLAVARTKALQYLALNEPTATGTAEADGEANRLRVDATMAVDLFFMPLIGVNSPRTISAYAIAGFGTMKLDAVLLLDATGSMAGNKINQAKIAAKDFKNTLLGSGWNGNVSVGVSPFRGCFRGSPQTTIAPKPLSATNCVNHATEVAYLTGDSVLLGNQIDAVTALGGSGTNICGALVMGKAILDGPNNHLGQENHRRFMILLSDGDNTYNSYSYQAPSPGPVSPYASCIPSTSPNNSDTYVDTACRSAQTRERQIDIKTYEYANALKAEGIEIFVVGFEVCGTPDNTVYSQSQCASQIGNTAHDNTADRRLLKCIASSKPGTNNRYWETNDASQLPAIFTSIANQIAHRLLE
jgi:Mg-chelatase subunit ChlD